MEAMRAAEQLEGLVRPLAALAAGTVASPPVHGMSVEEVVKVLDVVSVVSVVVDAMTCRFQALRSWVHEWHETDGALTACGLPAADERLASDDGQADCPGCLEVLAGERRAANAERAREARGRAGGEHGRSGADRVNVRVK